MSNKIDIADTISINRTAQIEFEPVLPSEYRQFIRLLQGAFSVAVYKEFGTLAAVINPAARRDSRTFRVKITIENSRHLLKPGMSIKAALPLREPEQVDAQITPETGGSHQLYKFPFKRTAPSSRCLARTMGQPSFFAYKAKLP